MDLNKAVLLKGVGLLLMVASTVATAAGTAIDTKKALTEIVKAELSKQ